MIGATAAAVGGASVAERLAPVIAQVAWLRPRADQPAAAAGRFWRSSSSTGALRTIASGNHTQTLALSVPLLVLDMYEHSYHIDFGAAAARYIDAFFANINWDVVNGRLEAAQRARTALRGGA